MYEVFSNNIDSMYCFLSNVNTRSGSGLVICHLIVESVWFTLNSSPSQSPAHPLSPHLQVSM